jgi:hypothetical protein
MTHTEALRQRLADEADLCRNDGADDIAALLDEARAALAAPSVPSGEPAPELDVRRIMLAIVPGDGLGLEVYATCVADVERLMTEMWQRIEDLESRPAAPPPFIVFECDARIEP